jgi:hypothetical protein
VSPIKFAVNIFLYHSPLEVFCCSSVVLYAGIHSSILSFQVCIATVIGLLMKPSEKLPVAAHPANPDNNPAVPSTKVVAANEVPLSNPAAILLKRLCSFALAFSKFSA